MKRKEIKSEVLYRGRTGFPRLVNQLEFDSDLNEYLVHYTRVKGITRLDDDKLGVLMLDPKSGVCTLKNFAYWALREVTSNATTR